MSAKNERICWALLAPMSAEQLRTDALLLRRLVEGDAEATWPDSWEVSQGTGAYSLLADREAGAEDLYEERLAGSLSVTTGKPAFVLYPQNEEIEQDWVIKFEGMARETIDESAAELAARFGCALPVPEAELTFPGLSFCVVFGENIDSVRTALSEAHERAAFEAVSCKTGTILRDRHGRLAYPPESILSAFPHRTIAMVTIGPEVGRFAFWKFLNSRAVAVFAHPWGSLATPIEVERLDGVDGEIKPESILHAISVNIDAFHDKRD